MGSSSDDTNCDVRRLSDNMQETLLPLTGRAQHHNSERRSGRIRQLIIANIRRPTVVIDFVHYICCIFEIQGKKPFIVLEMTFNGN